MPSPNDGRADNIAENKIKIAVIGGPTASGKTALSVQLAKEFDGEIISADSMQIYRYMDIGTAKPTLEERCGIPHYMIDIINPDEPYSVAQYVAAAHKLAEDISSRGKLPIVVGGTGLYINSLVNDVDFLENDNDTTVRNELEKAAAEKGIDFLVEELKSFDPVSAERIHKNNARRIIRAIEFYRMTGIPISEHQAETQKKESRYSPIMMAIDTDRAILYEKINKRVDIMMEQGLVDEVKRLCDMGYANAMLSMKGIGYKEILEYLRNETMLDEATEKIKLGTRHYAKRQLTWFNRDERIHRIPCGEKLFETAAELVRSGGI